jgi:hypothetical protein
VLRCLLEEMTTRAILRDAQERKPAGNARRKRRQDLLRLQVVRTLELTLVRGALPLAPGCLDPETGQLCSTLLEFVDAMRAILEPVDMVNTYTLTTYDPPYQDRDITILTSLRLHFAKTVTLLINCVPGISNRYIS